MRRKGETRRRLIAVSPRSCRQSLRGSNRRRVRTRHQQRPKCCTFSSTVFTNAVKSAIVQDRTIKIAARIGREQNAPQRRLDHTLANLVHLPLGILDLLQPSLDILPRVLPRRFHKRLRTRLACLGRIERVDRCAQLCEELLQLRVLRRGRGEGGRSGDNCPAVPWRRDVADEADFVQVGLRREHGRVSARREIQAADI